MYNIEYSQGNSGYYTKVRENEKTYGLSCYFLLFFFCHRFVLCVFVYVRVCVCARVYMYVCVCFLVSYLFRVESIDPSHSRIDRFRSPFRSRDHRVLDFNENEKVSSGSGRAAGS